MVRSFRRYGVFALLFVIACGLLPSARAADLPELMIGDAAPKLQLGAWVKGEPVKELDPDKIYVLEFWATWCGPCVKAMPHVTELQEKYKDKKVVVLGVNVADEEDADVGEFVKKQGEKIGYRVVRDDLTGNEKGKMVETWLEPAGQEGIPVSYVVEKGKIAWIGHPDKLGDVLAQVVDGKWDVKKAREEFIANNERADKMIALQEKMVEKAKAGDIDGALGVVDELVKLDPETAKGAEMMKFHILLQMQEYEKAYGMNAKLFDKYKDESEILNEIAWTIMDDEDLDQRDFDMSMKFAVRANEVAKGEDAAILDTLARAHFEKEDVAKAIEFQTKAVEKAGDDKELKKELNKTLKKYKAKKAV
ncbi:MAG: redoxin family protein [Pirellulales bacterium]